MSTKPDRHITVYIEDLVDVPKAPDEQQALSVRILQRKREKKGGEYQDVGSLKTDIIMALTEALAMILSRSDDQVIEAMDNGAEICHILMAKLATLLNLEEEDGTDMLSDFDIPEELEKKVKLLAPLFAEFKEKPTWPKK